MRILTEKDIEFTEELEKLKKKYEATFAKWKEAFDRNDPNEKSIEPEYQNEVKEWRDKFLEYSAYISSRKP